MYKKSNKGWMKHFDFVLIDMLSLEVSFFLAFLFRHGMSLHLLMRRPYVSMIFILILVNFMSMAILRTFSAVLRRGLVEEIKITIKQAIVVTLLSSFYLFTIQFGNVYSRITLILTGLFYAILSYTTRLLWKKYLKNAQSKANRAIVLIANEKNANDLATHFQENITPGVFPAGIILADSNEINREFANIPVIAGKDSMLETILGGWVDEVFFDMHVERKFRQEIENACLEMGITVHQALMEVEGHSEDAPDRNIERIGGYTVLTRSIRILTPAELFLKRLLDIIGAIIGCILTGFLMIFIVPAIKIASPGPVFFTQIRIGKNGKRFKMYKFRSMYLDAEERLEELKKENKMNNDLMFKLDYDPRIIGSEKGPDKGIGNFIRRTSIDEFPQFWNVLKGDMSLVGTRPPLVSEFEQYENHHRARMATKPGITGMWQVSGRSNITDFEEVVKLDMEYIENWSFTLDIIILFKTVLQVIKHDGAV